jgi:hypothetical protein
MRAGRVEDMCQQAIDIRMRFRTMGPSALMCRALKRARK